MAELNKVRATLLKVAEQIAQINQSPSGKLLRATAVCLFGHQDALT